MLQNFGMLKFCSKLGYANAPTPVMSRPTISVCIVSVPS